MNAFDHAGLAGQLYLGLDRDPVNLQSWVRVLTVMKNEMTAKVCSR